MALSAVCSKAMVLLLWIDYCCSHCLLEFCVWYLFWRFCVWYLFCYLVRYVLLKVSKGAKIRNRYNQVPHLTQDTNRKVTNSQLDTTNESQEVSPFPAGDHKAHINRRTQRHSKRKTEKYKISTKEVPPCPCNGQ